MPSIAMSMGSNERAPSMSIQVKDQEKEKYFLYKLIKEMKSSINKLISYDSLLANNNASEMDGDKVVIHLKQQSGMSIWHDIKTPLDHSYSDLPIISNTAYNEDLTRCYSNLTPILSRLHIHSKT